MAYFDRSNDLSLSHLTSRAGQMVRPDSRRALLCFCANLIPHLAGSEVDLAFCSPNWTLFYHPIGLSDCRSFSKKENLGDKLITGKNHSSFDNPLLPFHKMQA